MRVTIKTLTIALAIMVGMTFCFAMPDNVSAASKPGKVKGLCVKQPGTKYVVVQWKSSKKAKKYKVAYKLNGKAWKYKTVKRKNAKWNNVKIAVSPGKTYAFKVKAINGKKSSKWTKTIVVRSKAAPKPTPKPTTKPTTKPTAKPTTQKPTTKPNTPTVGSSSQVELGFQEVTGDFYATSTPKYVNKFNNTAVTLNLPCQGSVSCKSSNSNVVTASVLGNDIVLRGGNTNGTATITATFTPSSGYSYNGGRTVSFSTKNSVYPCNSDGSYSVTVGSGYSDAVKIGGCNGPFSDIYNILPTQSVLRVNANEMKRETASGSQEGWMGRQAPLKVSSISNKNVARIMASPIDSEDAGLSFLTSGETNITFANGKSMRFVVTGSNVSMAGYVNYVNTFINNNKNRSDYSFVDAFLTEVRNNYTYDGSRDAFRAYKNKGGNCWGTNRLLVRLCVERGITVREIAINIPGNEGTHRACIVVLNGVEYIADATPNGAFSFMTFSNYKTKYSDRTYRDWFQEDVPMKW